ncbi:MAG: hypothetical protein ACR2H2_01495 [Solirubrobacteraceae bacterium]
MSESVMGLVLLLIATVSAVGAVTAWTGVWRSWARQFMFGAVGSMPITLLPSVALMTGPPGLSFLGATNADSTFVRLTFLVGVLFFVLFLWNPRWWGPRWYREVRAGLEGGTIEADLSDPATALVVGAFRPPQDTSSDVVNQHIGGEPIETWPVTWIAGAETAEKAHAFERPGAVSGRLQLRREGIVFAASAMEDRIRGAATVLQIAAHELSGARAVSPGAGPDGARMAARGLTSRLARRVVPRLVITTNDGAFLFETYGADEKAKRMLELYELERSAP